MPCVLVDARLKLSLIPCEVTGKYSERYIVWEKVNFLGVGTGKVL